MADARQRQNLLRSFDGYHRFESGNGISEVQRDQFRDLVFVESPQIFERSRKVDRIAPDRIAACCWASMHLPPGRSGGEQYQTFCLNHESSLLARRMRCLVLLLQRHAVQVLAGSEEDLAAADRRRRAEIF